MSGLLPQFPDGRAGSGGGLHAGVLRGAEFAHALRRPEQRAAELGAEKPLGWGGTSGGGNFGHPQRWWDFGRWEFWSPPFFWFVWVAGKVWFACVCRCVEFSLGRRGLSISIRRWLRRPCHAHGEGEEGRFIDRSELWGLNGSTSKHGG